MLCVILQAIAQVTWHGKGDYFATVLPQGELGVLLNIFRLLSSFPFHLFLLCSFCLCLYLLFLALLTPISFVLSFLPFSQSLLLFFVHPPFFLSPFPSLPFLSVPPLPFRPSLPPSLPLYLLPSHPFLTFFPFLPFILALLPFLPSSFLSSSLLSFALFFLLPCLPVSLSRYLFLFQV